MADDLEVEEEVSSFDEVLNMGSGGTIDLWSITAGEENKGTAGRISSDEREQKRLAKDLIAKFVTTPLGNLERLMIVPKSSKNPSVA